LSSPVSPPSRCCRRASPVDRFLGQAQEPVDVVIGAQVLHRDSPLGAQPLGQGRVIQEELNPLRQSRHVLDKDVLVAASFQCDEEVARVAFNPTERGAVNELQDAHELDLLTCGQPTEGRPRAKYNGGRERPPWSNRERRHAEGAA